ILARMMAKDPKDRYQRPEHLVQHFILLAQKLGTGVEVPVGVLFVDAPLPGPPRTRPILMTASALLGLIVLIVVLGPTPLFQSATRGPSSALPRANEKGKIPPGTTAQTSENEPTPGGLVTHPTPPAANESGATAYRVAKA